MSSAVWETYFLTSLLGLSGPASAQVWRPVPAAPEPVRSAILLPAARDYNAPGGLPLRKLFDYGTRDPNICAGPDGYFYMVATASKESLPTPFVSRADADFWTSNDGIPLWRSKDLIHWETLGYVWTLDKDATWAKEYRVSPWVSPNKEKRRAVWAPEIHYLKGTYWIPYSMNYSGTGILKSTTGKPEGPYVDVKTDGPLTDVIDPTIFADDDGKVYMLWAGYTIARLKDDLSGLAEAPRELDVAGRGWGEGIFLVKTKGRYILINSGNPQTDDPTKKTLSTYDSYSAVSTTSIYGPYSTRYRAIPHDGHNNLFQDRRGNWWSSYFGSEATSPWQLRPGVLAVTISPEGRVRAKRMTPRPVWRYTATAPSGAWQAPTFGDRSWARSEGAFGDPKVAEAGYVTDVGTPWTGGDLWLRTHFSLKDAEHANPRLYLRNSGVTEIYVNGVAAAEGIPPVADYRTLPLNAGLLHTGDNTIAVHCRPGEGLPYIDIGIIADPPTP